MSETHHAGRDAPDRKRNAFCSSRFNVALVIFLTIAAFYLIAEHGAHFFGILPWLFLLACGLLHYWMHSGHGGHGSRSGSDASSRRGAHQH